MKMAHKKTAARQNTASITTSVQGWKFLTTLTINLKMGSDMSSDSFENIALLPSLHTLSFIERASIQTSWLYDLQRWSTPNQGYFLSLQTLVANISDAGMQLLGPHVRKLHNLTLVQNPLSDGDYDSSSDESYDESYRELEEKEWGPLGTISGWHLDSLSQFKIQLVGGSEGFLSRTDLKIFALTVPNLVVFDLSVSPDYRYLESDIGDSTINKLGGFLPKLQKFVLDLGPLRSDSDYDDLSEMSLISLMTRCPGVKKFYLSGIHLSYDRFLQTADTEGLRGLKSLRLNDMVMKSTSDWKTNAMHHAKLFVNKLPGLREYQDNLDGTNPLTPEIKEILANRGRQDRGLPPILTTVPKKPTEVIELD